MDESQRQLLLKSLYEQALQEQAMIGNADMLRKLQQQQYFNASRPREILIPMSENARVINKMYPKTEGETLQDLLKKLGGAPVSPGENF